MIPGDWSRNKSKPLRCFGTQIARVSTDRVEKLSPLTNLTSLPSLLVVAGKSRPNPAHAACRSPCRLSSFMPDVSC